MTIKNYSKVKPEKFERSTKVTVQYPLILYSLCNMLTSDHKILIHGEVTVLFNDCKPSDNVVQESILS